MSRRLVATLVSIMLLLPVGLVWGLVAAFSADPSDEAQIELVAKKGGHDDDDGKHDDDDGKHDDDDGRYPPKPDDDDGKHDDDDGKHDDDDGKGGHGGSGHSSAFTTEAGPSITVGMAALVLLAGIGFIVFRRWHMMRRLRE